MLASLANSFFFTFISQNILWYFMTTMVGFSLMQMRTIMSILSKNNL